MKLVWFSHWHFWPHRVKACLVSVSITRLSVMSCATSHPSRNVWSGAKAHLTPLCASCNDMSWLQYTPHNPGDQTEIFINLWVFSSFVSSNWISAVWRWVSLLHPRFLLSDICFIWLFHYVGFELGWEPCKVAGENQTFPGFGGSLWK